MLTSPSFVFDKARREARAKVQQAVSAKKSSIGEHESFSDIVQKLKNARLNSRINVDELVFIEHVFALGWDNGTRLTTILRLELLPIDRDVEVVEVRVCDKNSTTKKIILPLRVRPALWNAASEVHSPPTARWLLPNVSR